MSYSEAQGKSFVGHLCSLDGVPAEISGRALPFGVVAVFPQGPRFEYAWPTIARVMIEQSGNFKS